ncbi:MAG: NAD(P)/FAD-dependent oxidoreductase [Desulfurococcales archaeon]|nr:NAD(P)/FAD-dependent oxidoreductase [Desulfurococcales archaeon]
MGGEEFYIVGGGPAGAGAAVAASRAGFRPVVYEAHEKLAAKPCGRGIPVVGDLDFIDIPREAILNKIKSAVMYVNGEFLFELRNVFEGYIVDKGMMLEAIITSSGGEVRYRSRFDVNRGVVRKPGEGYIKISKGIFAGGHMYYSGERIGAIQWILESRRYSDSDTLEIYFDTELLGYYYVFPHGEGEVEVGVGGFEDFGRLRARLERFLRSREDLRDARRLRIEGARIAVGGLDLGYAGGLVKAGEAAGFVLPLTGEGIRPSMISGYIAARAIAENRDPLKALSESWVARAVAIQRRILEYAKSLSPGERAWLLKSLTPRAHAEIALGRMNYRVLAVELARSRGVAHLAARLLKYLSSLGRA